VSAGRRARWWGFHQLKRSWARRIVADADLRPGDLVLDIGAGNGALTAPLAVAATRVVAVELNPARLRALRERFSDDRVRVVRADAEALRLPRQSFAVVANPPFGVSTALIRRLLAPGSRLVAADLVLPRHTAVRWASGRGPGAERWSKIFDLHLGRRVPRQAFAPPAPGDCVVLVIRRR
jgi:23S rRNA (adenine-N6)-dimethyltransferase